MTIQLRYLQTLREIGGNEHSTIVFPFPLDLLHRLHGAGGGKAPTADSAAATRELVPATASNGPRSATATRSDACPNRIPRSPVKRAIVLRPTHPTASNVAIATVTQRSALAIRWTAAIVFLIFGAGKFVNHGSELASFRHYGLPFAGVFVYVIGVLEVAGGLLLARGLPGRAAALVLAADMVGAIVVSGIGQGEAISLTLAPALLVAMIFLLRTGAIGAGVGPRFVVRRSSRSGQDVI